MYEVFLDGVQIYSPGDPQLIIVNGKLELGDNKSGSFEFDLPVTNPAYDSIKKMTSEIIVKKDGTEIFYGRILSIDRNFNNMKSVVCEGELAYLLDSVQDPREFHNYTVRQFLTHLINVHNTQTNNTKKFTVGQTTVTDPNDSLYRYTNWETTLDDIMGKLVDRLGGHIRIRHSDGTRYIDYIEDYDHTNTQVIEFGENLLDYAENMDASEIATRVIPLGVRLETSAIEGLEEYTTIKSVNNNLPYVESAAAVKSFGIITKTVSFDDVTVPANLKTKAQKYLADVQYENLCLTCKAIDLNMVDGSVESIRLGDSIRVLSPPHGMDRYFPVTALTIYLDKPENNTVTLGTNVKAGLSERTAGDNSAVIKKINSIPPLSRALSMAKDNATALIAAATTGHVVTRPNEILIMDTADTATAKKVWRWNANGLGYSGTGYKGTYGLAMTIDGTIVADYITAGTMRADRIKGGTLILGGSNNASGLAQIKNAAGKVVAELNKDGISLSSGSLSIPFSNGTFRVDRNYVQADYDNNKDKHVSLAIPYATYGYSGVPDGSHAALHVKENNNDLYLTAYGLSMNFDYANHSFASGIGLGPIAGNGPLFRISKNSETLIEVNASGTYIGGNFYVRGTKSRIAETEDYGERLLYAYEMPSPMFGDTGEGVLGEDGLCFVSIAPVLAEMIVTGQYQVFLQPYGKGQCYVRARRADHFEVEGTPGLSFGWEIKAKQAGFDQLRLETTAGYARVGNSRDYPLEAEEHLKSLYRARTAQKEGL